jgi:hypothetical protein
MPLGGMAFSSLPIFDTFDLFDLQPFDGPVSGREETRLAASAGRENVVAYAPHMTELDLPMELSGYEAVMVDLTDRRVMKPVLRKAGSVTVAAITDANSDALFLDLRP